MAVPLQYLKKLAEAASLDAEFQGSKDAAARLRVNVNGSQLIFVIQGICDAGEGVGLK